MGTWIVLAVLVAVILLAVLSSAKHFKGEGSCCGGGGSAPKVKKQKLGRVAATKKIQIEGMHCDNCRKNVENGLNSLDQVNAKVNLKEKTAVVKLGEEIPDEVLTATVENLGYQVTGIENM